MLVAFRAYVRCVPKARWFRRRRSTGHRACCASDGGRPSGLAVTGGESKPPQAASGRKALVVSVAAKGPLPAGQVCDEKTSTCKPLLTHRNAQRRHRNRGGAQTPGQRHARKRRALSRGASLPAAPVVPGVEVA